MIIRSFRPTENPGWPPTRRSLIPIRPIRIPSSEQIKDVGWFCLGGSLVRLGLPTISPYPKLGPLLIICGLGASGNSAGFDPEFFYNKTEPIRGEAKVWAIGNLAAYILKPILLFCCLIICWPIVK